MDLQYLNLIRILVLFTLIHFFYGKRLKGNNNKYLMLLLLVCFVTEALNVFLSVNNINNGLYLTISIIIHNGLWLLILLEGFKKKRPIMLVLFVLVAMANLLFLEGIEVFNYWTFVFGAFMYLLLFIYYSFEKLSNEDLNFFTSSEYALMSAPLLFFLGLSFMFGFGSRLITSSPVFKNIDLYDCVIYLVNIIYYGLINAYLFHEKRRVNA